MEKSQYHYEKFSAREWKTSVDVIFRTGSDRPWGPPSLFYNGSRFSFQEESDQGVVLTTPCT
jgi:hypothetical protein